MIRFGHGSQSDLGRVRSVNQDAAFVADDLFIVADGMGGHRGGEVASEIAVTVVGNETVEPDVDGLVAAVVEANRRINNRSADDPELAGMGTTLVAMTVVGEPGEERLGIVNVGDSRCYLLDEGDLIQITDDHSLVGEMVRSGQLSRDEARDHPQKNILTRALGVDSSVQVDSFEVELRVEDRFLLCSDGLFNELTEDKMASVMRRYADPQEVASELVRLAVEAGGHDNVTVVIVDVVEVPEGVGDRAGVVGTVAHRANDGEPDPAGFGSGSGAGTGDDGDSPPAVVSTPTVDPAVAEPPPVDGSTGTGSGRELVPPAPPVKEARRARITWRVLVFALALVLLVGIGALAVSVISRGSYFVALTDDNEVAIFKGRPGGVLWIEPTIEMRSGLCNREAPGKYRTMLRNGRSFGDLAAAQELVENMIAEAEEMATASGEPLSGGRCDADSAANPDGEPTSATSAPATPTTAPIAGSPDEQ